MKKKHFIEAIAAIAIVFVLGGCSMLQSAINDIKGSLVGNDYNIFTYDNYGSKVLETSGRKISITGNPVKTSDYDSDGDVKERYELSSVITAIKGSESGALSSYASVARFLNKYKNMFGKSRIVVIKSQLGQPIAAYSGDEVYWKIPKNLPKMTKLMIDGKALYIHRANFQIIDKDLLEK